ncbi:acyl-CoA synthetase [Vibrio ponticus]|uniref:DUF3316 domain-containing protein n=1 Tax=Vibrio rhodolitus TaxID=2231649 RepID=UPI000507AF17|nr:DUF3316 domain-containing protein [Vibrio rhodolitus]GAK83670.1 acyl-CoA synthetase [Vibrio ponticus]
MKSLTTIAALCALTAASSVFAGGYHWQSKVTSIEGDVVASKQAAYDAGLMMINDYRSKSSRELRNEFSSAFDYVDRNSFTITDTKVTVDEFLQGDGQIAYQPVLDVRYEYRKREPGSR